MLSRGTRESPAAASADVVGADIHRRVGAAVRGGAGTDAGELLVTGVVSAAVTRVVVVWGEPTLAHRVPLRGRPAEYRSAIRSGGPLGSTPACRCSGFVARTSGTCRAVTEPGGQAQRMGPYCLKRVAYPHTGQRLWRCGWVLPSTLTPHHGCGSGQFPVRGGLSKTHPRRAVMAVPGIGDTSNCSRH